MFLTLMLLTSSCVMILVLIACMAMMSMLMMPKTMVTLIVLISCVLVPDSRRQLPNYPACFASVLTDPVLCWLIAGHCESATGGYARPCVEHL